MQYGELYHKNTTEKSKTKKEFTMSSIIWTEQRVFQRIIRENTYYFTNEWAEKPVKQGKLERYFGKLKFN